MTKRMIQIAILATALAGGAAPNQAATAAAQHHGTGSQPPAAADKPARPDPRAFEAVTIEQAVLGRYEPLKRRIERLRDLRTAEDLDRAEDRRGDGQEID